MNSWLLLHWLYMHDYNKIFNTAVGISFAYCIFSEHLAALSLCLAVAGSVFLVHSSVCNMKTLNTFAISVLPAKWLKMEESCVLTQAKS